MGVEVATFEQAEFNYLPAQFAGPIPRFHRTGKTLKLAFERLSFNAIDFSGADSPCNRSIAVLG